MSYWGRLLVLGGLLGMLIFICRMRWGLVLNSLV